MYLVLSSPGRPRSLSVRVDGKPVQAGTAGADVRGGRVTVRRQRLYELVALRTPGQHRLDLSFAPGVQGFAFTFG